MKNESPGLHESFCTRGGGRGQRGPLAPIGSIFFDPKKKKFFETGRGFEVCLDGGFKYVLFSSLFGEDSHVDYVSDGLKPPTS